MLDLQKPSGKQFLELDACARRFGKTNDPPCDLLERCPELLLLAGFHTSEFPELVLPVEFGTFLYGGPSHVLRIPAEFQNFPAFEICCYHCMAGRVQINTDPSHGGGCIVRKSDHRGDGCIRIGNGSIHAP